MEKGFANIDFPICIYNCKVAICQTNLTYCRVTDKTCRHHTGFISNLTVCIYVTKRDGCEQDLQHAYIVKILNLYTILYKLTTLFTIYHVENTDFRDICGTKRTCFRSYI